LGDHARKFKGPPSLEVVRERFPNYNFELATDSVEYLKDRFLKKLKFRMGQQACFDLSTILAQQGDELDDIDGLFLEQARRLAQILPTSSVARFSDMESRIEQYETGEDLDLGIRMGIPQFDALTQGIQPHEFVSIAGWQGTGKSTLCGWILFNAWLQDKTSLMISLEMESPALFRKWDTMLTNFEYRALKSRSLSAEQLERWRMKAKMVKERKSDIIVKDDVRSCTPDYVYGQIIRYEPDIVAVDYISLMETARSQGGSQMWEKVTYLTQSLKQIARTTGTPIIGVAQTNINSADGGARLDNISYSRSIGQDSDIVLGLHQDEEMKENKQMTVRMLKNRDGATMDVDLFWNMDRMMFGEWDDMYKFRKDVPNEN
jgi:replicative DNA helicase